MGSLTTSRAATCTDAASNGRRVKFWILVHHAGGGDAGSRKGSVRSTLHGGLAGGWFWRYIHDFQCQSIKVAAL